MAEQQTTLTWTGLLRGMGAWLRHNLPRALVMSAISFAFGWVVNFWVMAFRWDGFRAPAGESDYIAAQNSLVSGSLFWAALTSFLFAVIAYGHRAGWGQLRREVFGLPGRIGAMFKGEERNRSLTTLTWALALSLLLALVISPGVAAIAAGFFLAFAATPLGDLLSGLIRRLWVQIVARFAPHKGEPTSEVGAAAVTAAGMLAGFVIAAAVDVFLLKVLAVILAALAAYYFANEDELGPAGGAAVFILIAAAVGLYELFEAGVGVALADDGGWSECGNCNVIDYVTSTGATEVVSRSTVAGAGAGVGAPIGASVGDVLGSIGGGGGDVGGGGSGGDDSGGGSDDGLTRAGDADDANDAAGGDVLGAIGGGEGAVGDAGAGGDGGADDASSASGDAAPATRRQRPGDGGVGTPTATTVVLTGDAAREALQGQVGDEIDIPDDEQWDLDVSTDDRQVRGGHRGQRGRITGFGPVVEGENGELVVSVDVETGGGTLPDQDTSGELGVVPPTPTAPPPPPPTPPPTDGTDTPGDTPPIDGTDAPGGTPTSDVTDGDAADVDPDADTDLDAERPATPPRPTAPPPTAEEGPSPEATPPPRPTEPPPTTPRMIDRDGDGIDDRYELTDEDGTAGPSTSAGLRTHSILDRVNVPLEDREQLVSFADGETNEAYLPPMEDSAVQLTGPGGVKVDLQLGFWEQNGDAVRIYGTVEGYQVTADVQVVDGHPQVTVDGIDRIPVVGSWLSEEASSAIGQMASLDREIDSIHVDADGNLRIQSR